MAKGCEPGRVTLLRSRLSFPRQRSATEHTNGVCRATAVAASRRRVHRPHAPPPSPLGVFVRKATCFLLSTTSVVAHHRRGASLPSLLAASRRSELSCSPPTEECAVEEASSGG